MAIKNATPHVIQVVDENGGPLRGFPISGYVARVQAAKTQEGWLMDDLWDGQIPVVKTIFSEVTGLPDPDGKTTWIVSTLVAQALVGKRTDVVSPDTGETAVRDAEGKIVGVRRFQRF